MASKVKELRKWTAAVSLAFIVGGGVLLLSSGSGLRYLQNIRFGSPSVVCAGGLGVEFSPSWLLEVVYDGTQGSAALYGFLSIPKDWAKVSTPSTSISFRSLEKQGLHLAFHRGAIVRAGELRKNCSSSSSCMIDTISIGREVDVGRVGLKDGEWIVLLDEPVSIGIQGGKWEDVSGIRLHTCD